MLILLKSYLATKYRYFFNRKSLENWQHRQVLRHLKMVLPRSTFYRELYQGLDIEHWRQFPVITKKEMMDNFDVFNTSGIKKAEAFALALKAEETRDFSPEINGVSVGLSSGTSGSRGLFLASHTERMSWAGAILAKLLPKTLFHGAKIALFMRANSNLYTTLKAKCIHFEYYDSLLPLNTHIARLNLQQPSVLVAPPSMLRLLCSAKALKITPQKIISIAEVLDPLDQKVIERDFGQTVHQIYQATEGFLATTCRYGTLHLNEDLLVIQKHYIDEASGRFTPIITDFKRTCQPIIRYLLNDVLVERKEHCPCLSPFTAIEQVEGRCDDIFYLYGKDSKKLVPIFADFIRRAIITADDAIEEYLAVQQSPDKVDIALLVSAGVESRVQEKVRDNFVKLCDQVNVEVPVLAFSNFCTLVSGKKLRRVERRFQII